MGMLRDRIVYEIQSNTVRQSLLQNPSLTLDVAKTTAPAAEMTAMEASNMKREASAAEACLSRVHKIEKRGSEVRKYADSTNTGSDDCNYYGTRHRSQTCRLKKARCFKCSSMGQIARVCRVRLQHMEEDGGQMQWDDDSPEGLCTLKAEASNTVNRLMPSVNVVVQWNGVASMISLRITS